MKFDEFLPLACARTRSRLCFSHATGTLEEKAMEKIAFVSGRSPAFKRGIYISRIDAFGGTVLTTFDLRMKEPNNEPVMDVPALHTLEHMGATFLRSHPDWKDKTVYFGPMGCRTGMYMVLEGRHDSPSVVPLCPRISRTGSSRIAERCPALGPRMRQLARSQPRHGAMGGGPVPRNRGGPPRGESEL